MMNYGITERVVAVFLLPAGHNFARQNEYRRPGLLEWQKPYKKTRREGRPD
jgi:hypothetical protein